MSKKSAEAMKKGARAGRREKKREEVSTKKRKSGRADHH